MNATDLLRILITVERQQPRRKNRVMNLCHLGNRKVWRKQHQPAHAKLLGHLRRHAGPKRLPKQDDLPLIDSLTDQVLNIRAPVRIETLLSRLPRQSAVSAILRRQKSISSRNVCIATLGRIRNKVRVPMKKHDRERL